VGINILEEHTTSGEDGGSIFFQKGWYPTRLHAVITQKIAVWIKKNIIKLQG
jgi:hypothetical protein